MFFFDIIIMIGACYWDGEAPFCEGKCPEGYDECGRDDCGDGEVVVKMMLMMMMVVMMVMIMIRC